MPLSSTVPKVSTFSSQVEDYLGYSALYQKGIDALLADRGTLVRRAVSGQVFLRSVEKGPLHGLDVARRDRTARRQGTTRADDRRHRQPAPAMAGRAAWAGTR